MGFESLVKLGLLGIFCFFVVAYVVVSYNRLVSLKRNSQASFANIDVLLKQRHSEVNKLLETCKRYLKHESQTFEMIASARIAAQTAERSGDLGRIGTTETKLTQQVGQLMALAESYPDLKSDTVFVNLQMRIAALEESISDRKETYNQTVTALNTAIEQFPSNFVAMSFGFKEMELLKIEDEFKRDLSLGEGAWK